MQAILSTVLFLLSLGILILIHELGHFLVAKAFNVYVREFSIGFGPVLFSWTKGETKYALKAFPLGGYVAMVGEEVSGADLNVPFERSLLGISKPKRAMVLSAGIILNLVLAFVLFFISNWLFADYTFLEAILKAGRDWLLGVILIGDSLINLFRGENLDQVGGVIAIFDVTSDILVTYGFGTYIFIWGLISVNLAIFNLLPFPGLDGWHLLVITIEGIFKREIPSQFKNIVSVIGFFILMSLMVFLLIKDILALVLVL
jgi:membrane-associated protease RseP (regulator of RpoE activity)